MSLQTKDYDFTLPEELIASRPLADRAASRMMVVHRDSGRIEHRNFADFSTFLTPNDLVVLNDTKVIPARVFSDDETIQLICLDRPAPTVWRCLVRPGKKMKLGRELHVGCVRGVVRQVFENGDRLIQWEAELDLNTHGTLALPHYMGREAEAADLARYQTVFAREEGAIAAPTAGLHFTPDMIAKLPHEFLTLHVGVGTFRPVQVENLTEHVMHHERFHVSEKSCVAINRAGRVLAVGTTVVRVLESLAGAAPNGQRIPAGAHSGETDIFLHPPYRFRAVDAMLTNFHLPQSTLIMLVSAFAGRELVLEAYRQAVEERYRFYSYGDCMLLI